MSNDELKKKIVKILEEGYTPIEYDDWDCVQTYFPTNEDVADALIAAGIGDAKEAEYRAEVAERALLTVCTNVVTDEEDGLVVEPRARVLYKAYLKQSEKELAEEKEP